MREKLSKFKFKKISIESYKNGLRLHFDSILLFRNKSFPSSFQLSVLALEEFSKSYWVEHYYYSSVVNNNFPDKDFEQKWLNLLYFHPRKQKAFFGWGIARDYHDKFIKGVENGDLELQKQKATYVGLKKTKNLIDVNGRVSLPNQIREADAKKMISLLNDYIIDHCDRRKYYEFHFDISEKDKLLTDNLYNDLKKWKHRSGVRKAPTFASMLKKSSR